MTSAGLISSLYRLAPPDYPSGPEAQRRLERMIERLCLVYGKDEVRRRIKTSTAESGMKARLMLMAF